MRPIVQISLNLTSISEAIEMAYMAVGAGVDWLGLGTPLLLAEGLHGVRALRAAFPKHPIVADLKTMDGGYLETKMMAQAGATHVVVMSRAHPATVRAAVRAGREFGVKVMGDDLGEPDKPAACRSLQEMGVDYIVQHVGYDERQDPQGQVGGRTPSPLDELSNVVRAVQIPVQAAGALSLEQAVAIPLHGAPLVVLEAPLVLDMKAPTRSNHDMEEVLSNLIFRIRANGIQAKQHRKA